MLKNYLLVALRNLLKNKSYVIINTLGLGIALACCITAYLILAFNIEFDNFHSPDKVANIFKIHAHVKEKDGTISKNIAAPMPLMPVVVENAAGIKRYARYIATGGYMRYGDNAFSEGISFADSTFFEMFDYPLVRGNHQSFKNKHSIFLSQEMATKYFANDDPIGKIMVLDFQNDTEIEVTVGGVLAKVPSNNTFDFGALMRIENFQDIYKLGIDNWSDWRDPSTFVELVTPENASGLNKQLDKHIKRRNEAKKDVVVDSYHLVPFKSSFTQDDVNSGYVNLRNSLLPLVVFTGMAGLILLIACFNLTNTSIAMTGKRLKEVGVRKAVGALRPQIIWQFLLETIIIICLALFAGLIMAQLIVPAFVEMWNLPYGLSDLSGLNLFIALMIMIFTASLLAGIYPALFNSKFKPIALLKGTIRVKGTNMLTRTLVALQFALSVIVLVAGVIFMQNGKFQEQLDFGYDKEMIITFSIQSLKEFELMENEITKNPKILSVGVSDHNLSFDNYQNPIKIDTTEYETRVVGVGKNFLETMGMKLAEGRFFNPDNASDVNEAIIVNRAFLKKTNLQDPIEKVVTLHEIKRRIVGVVENHVDNLYRSKDPEAFVYPLTTPNYLRTVAVRADHSDLPEVKKYLESTWKSLFPSKLFQGQFQDELVTGNTKRVNSNMKKIFLFLTILGGLLSASGIFSLASLNIAKRTKEIGIRKALGASVPNIVALLNIEFIIILTIAGFVGAVGGYFLIDMLLSKIYAYHIPVSIGWVILCALTIFIVGILTTSSTIFVAAKANPVDTLRDE